MPLQEGIHFTVCRSFKPARINQTVEEFVFIATKRYVRQPNGAHVPSLLNLERF